PAELYRALAAAGGTLPRVRKDAGFKWASPSQSPEEHRRVVMLEKKAEESFGFEIQTYGLHHQDRNSVEMFTFVCRVHDGSPAEAAGLKAAGGAVGRGGGSEWLQPPQSSGNVLWLDTLYGTSIRRAELEARLQYLKGAGGRAFGGTSPSLTPPCLPSGVVAKDPSIYDTLESIRWCLQGEGLPGGSSRASGSDDSLYQTCVFASSSSLDGDKDGDRDKEEEDSGGPAPPPPRPRAALARSASLKCAGGPGAAGRLWARAGDPVEGAAAPRKSRHSSFRRRLLKFIPGLNRALEEEESHL
ncbi:GRASP protein, partial [Rhadina sibilatrix]|nr:GRASP protein [Rhadina sibilatrix]